MYVIFYCTDILYDNMQQSEYDLKLSVKLCNPMHQLAAIVAKLRG